MPSSSSPSAPNNTTQATGVTMKCDNHSCPSSATPQTNPKACARCRSVSYCSPECQTASWPAHKSECRPQNYVLYDLHLALQVAFGWATIHAFDFAVIDPAYVEPNYTLLEHIEMKRRMSMPGNNGRDPLAKREYLLRMVDPLGDDGRESGGYRAVDRMHEHGQREHPETMHKETRRSKLYKFFEDKRWIGKKMVYTYDFGDNWEHFFTIVGRTPATQDFVCLGGTGHSVAEDAGSWKGWEELKEAYRARNPTQDQRDRMAWFEGMAANADPLGLYGNRVEWFDRQEENDSLVEMWDRFGESRDWTGAEACRRKRCFQVRQYMWF